MAWNIAVVQYLTIIYPCRFHDICKTIVDEIPDYVFSHSNVSSEIEI